MRRSCLVLCGLLVWSCTSIARAESQTAPAKPDAKAPSLVHQIKVICDQAPDTSTLKSIVESVTRGCKTNDQKAVAIYNFMLYAYYHRDYPAEPGGSAALSRSLSATSSISVSSHSSIHSAAAVHPSGSAAAIWMRGCLWKP